MTNATTPVTDSLQSEVIKHADTILTGVENAVSKTTDFVGSQLPDLAREYITYGRVSDSFLEIVTFVLFFAGAYIVYAYGFKNKANLKSDHWGNWHGGRVAAIACGGFIFVTTFTIFMTNLGDLFLVWFAPKIWLIQNIVHLVKGQ